MLCEAQVSAPEHDTCTEMMRRIAAWVDSMRTCTMNQYAHCVCCICMEYTLYSDTTIHIRTMMSEGCMNTRLYMCDVLYGTDK